MLDRQDGPRGGRRGRRPAELERAVERAAPDVVVTDVRMPPTVQRRGHPARRPSCASTHPRLGVVVLSQYAEPGVRATRCSRAGSARPRLPAQGAGERPRQLAEAIRDRRAPAARSIDPTVVEVLVAPPAAADVAARRADARGSWRSSTRSRRARATPPSARALFLTERAVEKHINSLFAKLGLVGEPDVNRRVKAVLLLPRPLGAARGASTPGRRVVPLSAAHPARSGSVQIAVPVPGPPWGPTGRPGPRAHRRRPGAVPVGRGRTVVRRDAGLARSSARPSPARTRSQARRAARPGPRAHGHQPARHQRHRGDPRIVARTPTTASCCSRPTRSTTCPPTRAAAARSATSARRTSPRGLLRELLGAA